MALGDYNPDYKPNLKGRREEINNTSYEVLDKLHSQSDFSRWCKNCTYFLEEVRQLLLELTSLNLKGRREMSEPVLYVDVFGVIYNVLPTGLTYPVCLPLGGQLDEEAKIQLLKQDFKIQEQHIFEQHAEIKRLKGIMTDQEDVIDDFKQRLETQVQMNVDDYVPRKFLETQKESICSLQEENIRLGNFNVSRNKEIQRLKEQILKYQKDIFSLLYGRPVDSHPGRVIDAQEKIITKLQAEVKEWKEQLHYEQHAVDEKNKVIRGLQDEVKKLEQRNHQWSVVSVVETEKISKLRNEVKEWKERTYNLMMRDVS